MNKQVRFRFGDIIENGWVAEENPLSKGIFVRHSRTKIELTNGKGRFWEVVHDRSHKNLKVGRICDYENVLEISK